VAVSPLRAIYFWQANLREPARTLKELHLLGLLSGGFQRLLLTILLLTNYILSLQGCILTWAGSDFNAFLDHVPLQGTQTCLILLEVSQCLLLLLEVWGYVLLESEFILIFIKRFFHEVRMIVDLRVLIFHCGVPEEERWWGAHISVILLILISLSAFTIKICRLVFLGGRLMVFVMFWVHWVRSNRL